MLTFHQHKNVLWRNDKLFHEAFFCVLSRLRLCITLILFYIFLTPCSSLRIFLLYFLINLLILLLMLKEMEKRFFIIMKWQKRKFFHLSQSFTRYFNWIRKYFFYCLDNHKTMVCFISLIFGYLRSIDLNKPLILLTIRIVII